MSRLDPYFVARARQAIASAGGDPDTAVPLAWWAQAAHAAGDERRGVIVTETGKLVGETRYDAAEPGAWREVDDGWELSSYMGRLRREHGPVVHVAYSEVCRGAARPDDLITTAEAAEIAGLRVETFRSYSSRGDAGCPGPVRRIGRTPLWDRAAVIGWCESRPRVRHP